MSRAARRFQIIVILVFAVSSAFAQAFRTLDANIERKIDSLLPIMTLEEKLGQLNQRVGFDSAHLPLLRQGKIGSFLGVVGAEATRRLQQVAVQESRLHIPLIFGLDVIHGFKTTFPIPLAGASTWNPELIERAERIAAKEATAAGIHWTFAPMVDIARDPRWGRIAEGSGEDPFLGSAMGAAKVRGFQGSNLSDPQSMLACAKHFAAYGAAEGGRDYNTVDISEWTLRELYIQDEVASVTRPVKELKGFHRISLNADEKKRVEFTLKPEHLMFWNREMKFAVEPGMFRVFVGGNSVEVLETRFEIR